MSLLIMKPGLLTTVQDLGRYGYQQYGVIAGGAMDSYALRMANLLVGNEEQAAGLEMTVLGPEITFAAPALIAVCGGGMAPLLDGQPLPLWRTAYVPKGTRLHFGRLPGGCRAYLAVAGGIDVPVQLNSRSTYLRAGIGGHQGRALRSGDVLPVGTPSSRAAAWTERLTRVRGTGSIVSEPLNNRQLEERSAVNSGAEAAATAAWYPVPAMIPDYPEAPVIRVIEGEEYEMFSSESRRRFLSEPYTILPESDRMGYRLSGSALSLVQEQGLASAAVTFGTIQVPAEGTPIILMADRQTTGGYPKLAQVITADLSLLAQAPSGSRVHFRLVTLRESQEQLLQRELELRRLRLVLQHV
ncbi:MULTISPECIES: biotin-dependent carboxyltransferase family protein [unclassified Paenibacillus]|uniref:5-oxoprolinase subunit C family protein n=1 Tax=unclassified Paenibacillus TaxID=185978 RepID=UPI0024053221|nr:MULTISPECIES: biotin-dependent carboxyltransferase family protein [unclassified Paenibacillus]MDF9845031.1 antagonist of KipI [Paenibacillus sp. PastF-2]MDF9851658.1 antagonist of KipI [Paenibacillus sp. PastM-2]MDF9858242.1 antagonist of KipI [Paenibacillus sp. PastF-1]MDH6483478.1 antagonist of KipI [Paenibacillus sp. PastH-2]MDH6510890.1 antagonist of KipI [Paenibacillus sp. PastM-3]